MNTTLVTSILIIINSILLLKNRNGNAKKEAKLENKN